MKGFWRLVESVIAVVILMFFVLSLSIQYMRFPEESEVRSKGYEVLRDLDRSGKLRPYVISKDFETLNSNIEIPNYNHSIRICDSGGSCVGNYPDVSNVWVSTYIISGKNTYEPREVRLYLWREE
jgi:hypothetical protein